MGTPYRGFGRPVISQHGDTLTLDDWGDFFTQEAGNEHIDRHAVQWERETGPGSWEVIPPRGPQTKRSLWEARKACETPGNSRLKLGPENVGRRFRAQTWGGFGPSVDGGTSYVEWGNSDGSHGNDDVPSERSYSEVLTVQPFGTPPPPPAGNGDAYAHDSLVLAKKALVAWEDAGVSKAQRELTTAWVTVHEKTASAVVKKEIRRLLGAGS